MRPVTSPYSPNTRLQKRFHWPMVEITGLRISINSIYSSRPTGNADHDRLAGIRYETRHRYVRAALTIRIESRRSSNDSRRTRPDDRLENTRRRCTPTREPPATQHLLEPWPKRPLPAPRASVPIAGRWAISRQTKSTDVPIPVSPPPRPSFSWSLGDAAPVVDKRGRKRKRPRQDSVLSKILVESDARARKRAQERIKADADCAKADAKAKAVAEKDAQKAKAAAEKEAAKKQKAAQRASTQAPRLARQRKNKEREEFLRREQEDRAAMLKLKADMRRAHHEAS